MKVVLYCTLLGVATLAFGGSLNAGDVRLVAGTLVQCTIDEPNFSTKTAEANEPVVCYTRSVRTFGCFGALEGSEFAGRLVALKQPGHFVGKGWMMLEFDRLVLPEGIAPVSAKVISIQGVKVDGHGKMLGKGHPLRDAAEWAVPVLWPVKVVTLPRRGPAPTLRGEHVVTLRLMDDTEVPCTTTTAPGWRRFGPTSWNPSTGWGVSQPANYSWGGR